MRVGIIGCGQISRAHISSIAGLSGARVVAVCDQDEPQGRRVANEFAIAACYRDPRDLLARESLDVVHVLTPPSTHGALATQAMNAGSHVLVEKPMALSLAEADRVAATARQTGRRLCVDHSRLFDPLVLKVKQSLSEGVLGDLLSVEYFQGFPARSATHNKEKEGAVSSWLPELDLGVVQDLAPHALAFLLEFLGPPQIFHVVSQGGSAAADGDEARCRELKILAAGESVTGSFTVSLGSRPFMCWLRLYGSRMTVEVDFNRRTLVHKKERNLPRTLQRGLPVVEESLQLLLGAARNAAKLALGKLPRYPGIQELVHRFYRSLGNGGEPPVTIEQGREVVRLMDRVVEHSRKEMLCAS